jgi:hypothetical protein
MSDTLRAHSRCRRSGAEQGLVLQAPTRDVQAGSDGRWPSPGIYPPIQTFHVKSTDNRLLYNGTVQISPNLRARISGNNQKTQDALALPGIDSSTFIVVDGKSIATAATSVNPATFNPQSQVHQVNWNDSYSVTTDWTIDTKTFASSSGGYPAKSHDPGVTTTTTSAESFSSTNIDSRRRRTSSRRAGHGWQSQHAFASGRLLPLEFRRRPDALHALQGPARGQGGHPERYANDVDNGAQYPNVSLS